MESLQYSARILDDPGNMLLLYPTGEIQASYISSFSVLKGLDRIINPGTEIRFYACLVDYFSHRKPSARIYFRKENGNNTGSAHLERSYNEFYAACILRQNEEKK